jgi:hypothetical protein
MNLRIVSHIHREPRAKIKSHYPGRVGVRDTQHAQFIR